MRSGLAMKKPAEKEKFYPCISPYCNHVKPLSQNVNIKE